MHRIQIDSRGVHFYVFQQQSQGLVVAGDHNSIINNENSLENLKVSDIKENIFNCALIGIPNEYSIVELMNFIGSYMTEIHDAQLLQSQYSSYQIALLTFYNHEALDAFITLYSYQHFPLEESYDQICIALQVEVLNDVNINTLSLLKPSNSSKDKHDDEYRKGWIEFPQCPYCIGRIHQNISKIHDCNTSLPLIINNSTRKRCQICDALYSHMSGHEVPCTSCGLVGNIWVCLICGNCGCGYYSRQHAKEHFEITGHSLGIELATGRIWNYTTDNFVHSPSSDIMYLMTEALGERQQQNDQYSTSGRISSRQLSNHNNHSNIHSTISNDQDGHRKLVEISSETRELFEDEHLLDPITTAKLRNLTSEYESLIATQLYDQEMHYEKQMARETIEGLRIGVMSDNNNSQQTNQQNSDSQNNAFSSSNNCCEHVALSESSIEDMREIENLKLEISSIEQEYSETLALVRIAEKKAREVKKENEFLIKEQKRMRDETAAIVSKAEELVRNTAAQVEDLNQQVTDLNFFSKTKNTLASSELGEEAKDGSVVIVNTNGSSNNNSAISSSSRRTSSGGSKPRKR